MRRIRISLLALGLVLFIATIGSATDSVQAVPLVDEARATPVPAADAPTGEVSDPLEQAPVESVVDGEATQRNNVCECGFCEDHLNSCNASCAPGDVACFAACRTAYSACASSCW